MARRGDFNEIISVEEKKGGALRNQNQIKGFQEAMNHCRLLDAGFKGDRFTWKRGKLRRKQIKERLDRFFINHALAQKARSISVQHLSFYSSDHRPILAKIVMSTAFYGCRVRGKILRFEEGWLNFKYAKKVVNNSWKDSEGRGAHHLNKRIAGCIKNLHLWSKERLKGSIQSAIRKKEEEIKKLEAEACVSDDKCLDKAEMELEILLEEEEHYWRSRSREVWLKSGDRNTKWFHAKASQRRKKNRIEGIFDPNGNWRDKEEDIARVATEYFKTFYSNFPSLGMTRLKRSRVVFN